jgi:hypothetical protein
MDFMKGLDYENCTLMGLDSLLQVNEVHENFAEITANTTTMDDDGFNNEARKSSKKPANKSLLDVLNDNINVQISLYHNE